MRAWDRSSWPVTSRCFTNASRWLSKFFRLIWSNCFRQRMPVFQYLFHRLLTELPDSPRSMRRYCKPLMVDRQSIGQDILLFIVMCYGLFSIRFWMTISIIFVEWKYCHWSQSLKILTRINYIPMQITSPGILTKGESWLKGKYLRWVHPHRIINLSRNLHGANSKIFKGKKCLVFFCPIWCKTYLGKML